MDVGWLWSCLCMVFFSMSYVAIREWEAGRRKICTSDNIEMYFIFYWALRRNMVVSRTRESVVLT
jgi:hypothetical protein